MGEVKHCKTASSFEVSRGRVSRKGAKAQRLRCALAPLRELILLPIPMPAQQASPRNSPTLCFPSNTAAAFSP
jgi:hypothetical protein